MLHELDGIHKVHWMRKTLAFLTFNFLILNSNHYSLKG